MRWWSRSGGEWAAWATRLGGDDPVDRVVALVETLAAWWGHPIGVEPPDLPGPLAEFYRRAGRWACPYPERSPVLFDDETEGYFYVGTAHAHLRTWDRVRVIDGRFEAFCEQAGNWVGAFGPGIDPRVFVREAGGEWVDSGETLSRWIVAHCLAAVVWEEQNHLDSETVWRGRSGFEEARRAFDRRRPALLFESRQTVCPELSGAFHAVGSDSLAHLNRDVLRVVRVVDR